MRSAEVCAERPGGCPGPLSLRSALGAWLGRWGDAAEGLGQLSFGVGRATLERIVSGEVEPDDALAARIWAAVRWPGAPAARPLFALRNEAGGRELAMAAGGDVHLFPMEDARAMHAELGALIALHDGPPAA